MAIEDIGYMIFAQFLGMSQYPGAPFTGNLFRDLIMFLIVPTIFIILIIYSMTGRIVADSKLRLMLGLGAYLFILASGYYSAFALLSGPYFIFLIFVMGLLYFIFGHFTGRAPRAAAGAGGPYRERGEHVKNFDDLDVPKNSRLKTILGVPTLDIADRKELEISLKKINHRVKKLEELIEKAHNKPGTGDLGRMSEQMDRLIRIRQEIEDKLHWS